MMRIKFVLLASLAITYISGCSHRAEAQHQKDFPVISYRVEDPSQFNQNLVAEISGGDISIWQVQPMSLAMRYLEGLVGGNYSQLTKEIPPEASQENPDTIIITAIQDGYLDDALRGEWLELTFKLRPDGIWKITQVKRAFLCYRGENIANFQQDFCP